VLTEVSKVNEIQWHIEFDLVEYVPGTPTEEER
jgi:hypothetical protein